MTTKFKSQLPAESFRSPWLAVGKQATLKWSENIGLPVELRMPSWQTLGSVDRDADV